jgi:Fic family protein
MHEKVILTQIPIEELKATLKTCIREEIAISKSAESKKLKSDDPELLTIQEISKLFKVSKVTIHSWIKKGILKPIKRSSRTYFIKSEIINGINDSMTLKNRGRN